MSDNFRIPVSVLMLTLNEEANLRQSLPLLAGWVDDVVILDSFSTDQTIEVAKHFGARVLQHKFEGHAKQWLWGMREIDFKHEWIFMHDPDQRSTTGLLQELETLFGTGVPAGVNGLYVGRRAVFRGKWIRHGGYYPKYMLRVVRRNLVEFDENEFDYRAYVPGRTLKLKGDVIEENLKENDINWWIEKHNQFSIRQAREEIFRAHNPNRWKTPLTFWGNPDQRVLWLKERWYGLPLYLRPFLYFGYRYFLRLGFLDGKVGFAFHFLQAFWYRFLVDMKLEELRQMEKDRLGSRER